MAKIRYFQCPAAVNHLCGIGDVYCEYCNMNITTGRFPLDRPYKLPVKLVEVERDDRD